MGVWIWLTPESQRRRRSSWWSVARNLAEPGAGEPLELPESLPRSSLKASARVARALSRRI